MATLKAPSVSILFEERGTTAVERSARGIVALLLKDTAPKVVKIYTTEDIPDNLSEANKRFIRDALKGSSSAPRYVLAYVMATAADMGKAYTDAKKALASEDFTYLAAPYSKTDSQTAGLITWVKEQREADHLIKAVLPDVAGADSEGIINWASTLTRGNATLTAEEGTPRIAGLLAGTGLKESATFAPLKDFDDVSRLTKTEADAAVGAGKLVAVWDGEKVKLSRAVTSLTTTTAEKKDSFKKIRLVEIMDMMKTDIKRTAEDGYIGRFQNSYDNKLLLITAISQYMQGLVADGALAGASCGIDVAAQRKWLTEQGKPAILEDGTEKPVGECSDDEIKKANTGSHVFLRAAVSMLDAMEDIDLVIRL